MVIKEEIDFAPAKDRRRLHIYLPDDYNASDERYPVMYYFDGHNLFFNEDATYGTSWGLAEFLAQWPKKMIVVGIECNHEGTKRLDEYSPYTFDAGHFANTCGTGRETMDFMAYTLKPYIDSRYRTYAFREATGIAGSSMGGLMSMYAVTCYNDVYSKAACLSSAVGMCWKQLKADLDAAQVDPDTRIYMSIGAKEGGAQHARFQRMISGVLKDKGATVDFYYQYGGAHCEADWAKQNERYMDFLWRSR